MTKEWQIKVSLLDYAYQPIVSSYSGEVYGYEALLRNWDLCGFPSIFALLDAAFSEKVLYALDRELRRKAIKKFLTIKGNKEKTLFYNLDNRVLEMPDYIHGNTTNLLTELNMPKSNLVFEVSERHEFNSYFSTSKILDEYKRQNFRIAMDDYGSGYSGLKLLYHISPDILKIDRFFIEGIQDDPQKKLLAENIANMAHLMGIKVVAEGIETTEELNYCRIIGCDFLQGYGIARPEQDLDRLKDAYDLNHSGFTGNRNQRGKNLPLPEKKLKNVVPVSLTVDGEQILNRFLKEDLQLLPVIDSLGRPIGCIREKDLKNYVYTPFGISLFRNHCHSKGLESFLHPIPVMENTKSLESLMKTVAAIPESQGILITRNGKYIGILEPSRLIALVNEQEIAKARDQNPLTHLPGNFAINRRLKGMLKYSGNGRTVVYFDFNHFKPFNDVYGFRLGDRVIKLFAEILKKELNLPEEFVGHIGGDDFIAIINDLEENTPVYDRIRNIQEIFAESASTYYREEHRKEGCLIAKDRAGLFCRVPLLSVSAAVMEIHSSSRVTLENFTQGIANLKKKAKEAPGTFTVECFSCLREPVSFLQD